MTDAARARMILNGFEWMRSLAAAKFRQYFGKCNFSMTELDAMVRVYLEHYENLMIKKDQDARIGRNHLRRKKLLDKFINDNWILMEDYFSRVVIELPTPPGRPMQYAGSRRDEFLSRHRVHQ
jgi:hypothetical protein